MRPLSTHAFRALAALLFLSASSASSAEDITATTFDCIRDMTPVRHFYVDNLNGDIEATVAVANSPEGGAYPEGSVVQLVPGEAMIKRSAGFSPATNDWEFFELDVSPEGTAIRKRGFADVVNRFGGNCFACHVKAEAKWDLICDNNHGCDPIPLTRSVIATIQKTDPRCDAVPLTDEDKANLEALKAFAAANSAD
jgi:hypothetical protein